MKTSAKVLSCILFLILLTAAACVSKDVTENEMPPTHGEWVGVWQLTEIILTGPEAQTITVTEPGYLIVTDKYGSFTGVIAPRAELPENPTDAQIAAAYNSFNADIVKYSVEGNTITAETLVDRDPNIKQGSISTMDFKVEGDILSITQKEEQGVPVENPYTLKFTRLE